MVTIASLPWTSSYPYSDQTLAVQIDQDAFQFHFPILGLRAVIGCAPLHLLLSEQDVSLRQLVEGSGQQGTAAWASVSPKLRKALQECCSPFSVIEMAHVSRPLTCLPHNLAAFAQPF